MPEQIVLIRLSDDKIEVNLRVIELNLFPEYLLLQSHTLHLPASRWQ